MSSCAKDEVEAPSNSNGGEKAIVLDELYDINGETYTKSVDSDSSLFLKGEDGEVLINDDGDDEDEERGPN